MEYNKLYLGHAIDVLKTFPDECVDCFITSPPYWNLRAYQTSPIIWGGDENCDHEWGTKIITGQHTPQTKWKAAKVAFSPNQSSFCKKCSAWLGELGAEPDPDLFITHLCDVFDQVKRVLKPTGTAWINIGDTYGCSGGAGGDYNKGGLREGQPKFKGNNYQPKSLVGIPERMVLEMQNRGWCRRNTIFWKKNNVMPSCLSKNTKIFIKHPSNRIERIKIGDLLKIDYSEIKILSKNGWVEIKNVWSTKKRAYEMKCRNVADIKCSKDHRFAVVRDTHKNRTIKEKYDNIMGIKKTHSLLFYDASIYLLGDIDILDITDLNNVRWRANLSDVSKSVFKEKVGLTPTELAKVFNDPSFRKYFYGNSWSYASDTHNEYRRQVIKAENFKRLNIPFDKVSATGSYKKENRFFKLNYNLGWLLGLYAAEGGFNQPRGFQGKVTLNKKEKKLITRFLKLLKSIFCIKANKVEVDNYTSLVFSSSTFYSLAKYIIPGKCKDKRLNINFLLNTPVCFRKGIKDGYLDGDGSYKVNGYSVTSASKDLIYDFKTLLYSIGEMVSVCNGSVFDKKTSKMYKYYTLYTNSYLNNVNDTKYIYCGVSKISDTGFIEEMVDIEVGGDNTFIIEDGLVSHNSARDRFTNDTEYIYFFVKNTKYYFKQQFEPYDGPINRWGGTNVDGMGESLWDKATGQSTYSRARNLRPSPEGRNMRTTWVMNVGGDQFNKGKHFAAFPSELPFRCIKAGCQEGGIVLDCFVGSGTTCRVAYDLGRKYLGIELNPEFLDLAKKRLAQQNIYDFIGE